MTDNAQRPFTVRCQGEFTFSSAQQVRNALSAAIEKHNLVVADVTPATEIDITFIQLLVSAQKSAALLGKTLLVKLPEGGPVAAKVQSAAVHFRQPNEASTLR